MGIFDRMFRKETKVNTRDNNPVEVRYIGQQKKYSTVTDANEAMKNSIVYRAISILSDSVASIPFDIYHKNKKGYWEVDGKSTLHKLLSIHPNNRMNSYELIEGTVIQLILEGNAYLYITRNTDYEITGLTLLYPKTVFYNIDRNEYTVTDTYNKIKGIFGPDKIIHIRHKSINTLKGDSIIKYAGKTIGLSSAADNEALNTFQNGGRLKGIISSENSLTGFSAATDSQVETIAQNLQAEIDSGKDILTLQSGAEFKPMSQSMRDLQIVDIKNVTLADLTRYFGISPVKLGILMGGNYQAALQDSINFYTDTLNPLLTKIERAFNDKLIPESVNSKYKVEFDRTALPYYKEILSNYEKMFQLGMCTVNDIRYKLNKPFVDGGDNTFISTNLQSVEQPKVNMETDTEEDVDVQEKAQDTTEEKQE